MFTSKLGIVIVKIRYERVFGFHRFWSIDDTVSYTQYSSMRVVAMTNFEETFMMPVCEPASGFRARSQIQV